MLTLSQASIIEKNKIATDGVWLMLLQLAIPGEETIRLVNNTDNVTFQGNEYTAFPFSLEDINEDGKERPNVQLRISNVTGTIQAYAETHSGLTGAKVTVLVYNTNVPDVIEAEEHFVITGTSADVNWLAFTLGTDFSFTRRFPPVRIMKDYCPFKFRGAECGYRGSVTSCNKTLTACRAMGNQSRFGGEPTIPQGGLYASNK